MPNSLRQNPDLTRDTYDTYELVITTYVETIAEREAEIASLRADRAYCCEVITAAVEALHRAHVRGRRRDEQHAQLLEECHVLRELLRAPFRPSRAA